MNLAGRIRNIEETVNDDEKPLSKREIVEAENFPFLLSGVIPEHYTKYYKKLCKKFQKDVLSVLGRRDECKHAFPKMRDDNWKHKDCTKCGIRLYFNGNVAHNNSYYSYWEIIEQDKGIQIICPRCRRTVNNQCP